MAEPLPAVPADTQKSTFILYEGAYEKFVQEYGAYFCYSVYILTSPLGKRYVGYCKGNPTRRWGAGERYQHNRALYADIRRFGWYSFDRTIHQSGLSLEDARDLERSLILSLESWKPEFGYNRIRPAAYPSRSHYSVYQLIFPDGKMYVGSTGRPLEERWQNGYGYRDNPELYQAIGSVGWENITKIRCVENILEESARAFEAWLIEVNRTTDPSRGYNKSLGGTVEHGWKMSSSSKARTFAANKGIVRTPQQREIYKRCKAPVSTPVYCEETHIRYPSMREAARQLDLPKTTLIRRLNSGKNDCRGYHFIVQKG